MFFAWNASGSIVKQNDCENKTPWLTQTALSKSFSLYLIPLTLKTLKNFLKDYFFVQNLFYIKRLSNKIIFKFSKSVDLNKDCEWHENRIACRMRENNCHGVRNAWEI